MSTLIDLARKSKNYERTLFEVKNEIKRMDSLLETLLLITRVEEKVELDKEKIDVVPSLRIVLNQLKEEFADKKVHVKESLPNSLVIAVHQQ
jgi:signal transduction histidine kinase